MKKYIAMSLIALSLIISVVSATEFQYSSDSGATWNNLTNNLLSIDGKDTSSYLINYNIETSSELPGRYSLFLKSTTADKSKIAGFYNTKPEPYKTYLLNALNGSKPFAFVSVGLDTKLNILDGAQFSLNAVAVPMVIPGNYFTGDYYLSNGTKFSYKLSIKNIQDVVAPLPVVEVVKKVDEYTSFHTRMMRLKRFAVSSQMLSPETPLIINNPVSTISLIESQNNFTGIVVSRNVGGLVFESKPLNVTIEKLFRIDTISFDDLKPSLYVEFKSSPDVKLLHYSGSSWDTVDFSSTGNGTNGFSTSDKGLFAIVN